jgi:hypothetical protein
MIAINRRWNKFIDHARVGSGADFDTAPFSSEARIRAEEGFLFRSRLFRHVRRDEGIDI